MEKYSCTEIILLQVSRSHMFTKFYLISLKILLLHLYSFYFLDSNYTYVRACLYDPMTCAILHKFHPFSFSALFLIFYLSLLQLNLYIDSFILAVYFLYRIFIWLLVIDLLSIVNWSIFIILLSVHVNNSIIDLYPPWRELANVSRRKCDVSVGPLQWFSIFFGYSLFSSD